MITTKQLVGMSLIIFGAALAQASTGSVMGKGNCPDLQGQYTCNYKGFGVGASVVETEEKNYTSYFIDYRLGQVTIHPDGQEHTIDRLPPMDRHARNFKYKAYCKGNKVDFAGTGDMVNGRGQATLNGSLVSHGNQIVIEVIVVANKTHNIRLVCNKR